MKPDWQIELANNIKSFEQLKSMTQFDKQWHDFSNEAHVKFRTKFPSSFLQVEDGQIGPLLAQVLPAAEENITVAGYRTDPVGDLDAMVTPGLIHKYSNRALFIVTGACAIHCRYCFRRHFPYSDAQINSENWEPAFDYLRQHQEITEIILSGGDPLMLNDEKFQVLVHELEQIPHLKRLRIHSRIPSVLPSRITEQLLTTLTKSRFQMALVTHINHGSELKEQHKLTFKLLKDTGMQLLNQSVLLANINNSAEILRDLSEKLYELGILPYYLHLLDPVEGAAHFSVKEADAKKLMDALTTSLPGYLVPRLVKEIAGEKAKTRIL